jgi:DNA-binding response OmpR family regulator
MHQAKIMAVDDDPGITSLLKTTFELEGCEVLTANKPEEVITTALNFHPDLMLLDLMMPHTDGSDGIYVCRTLREDGNHLPIIILSGISDPDEKARLLNLGADDYMTKPFDPGELVARVNSVLRRSSNFSCQHSFACRDISVDFDAQKVTFCGKEVNLSSTEYRLLEELVWNTGHVLSCEYLLANVWGTGYEKNKEYLYVYIGYLRKKLEKDPSNPQNIISVPGRGYRFDKK